MKISFITSTIRLTVDLTEDQISQLLHTAINLSTGDYLNSAVDNEVSPAEETSEEPCGLTEVKETSSYEIQETTQNTEHQLYKGFLYLQCESCGKYKAFMPKTPISKYHCECGEVTKLCDLVPMYVKCECGQVFKYHTNSMDSLISIDCLNCGNPVSLEYNHKKCGYHTI